MNIAHAPIEITPQIVQLAIFALVSASAVAVLLAFSPGRRDATRHVERMRAIAGTPKIGRRGGSDTEETRRRRHVEDAMRELDAKQGAKARKSLKPTLVSRMRQGGLNWTRGAYFAVCGIVAAIAYAIALATFGLGMPPAIAFGAVAGLLLPHLYVSRRRNARFRRFSALFPDALDVVVRGVKAGLPLIDCLKTIATESQEPVCSEFKLIVQDQSIGIPLGEAVERMADRTPLSEINFFSIVITIQARTGGNLSEALGNLTKVLRDRKNLQGKIKAMSAEAKASAGIIASMPLVVSVLLYFTSPDYIGLLFSTTIGNAALGISAVWMFVGVMVMRNMINFEL